MLGINHIVFHARKGFSLVEIIVVITAIALLVGVGVYAATSQQKNANDAEREAKANIIASSLEKYYDKNNEYPGCTSLTSAPSTVKSTVLTNLVDANILTTPRAANGVNSIKCAEDITSSPEDAFTYTCTNSVTCAEWKLKYRNDSDKKVKTISSRRGSPVGNAPATLDAPEVAVTTSISGQNAVGTASADCEYGSTPQYQIRSYKEPGAFPATWTNASSATVSPLAEGESAVFQAQALCGGHSASNPSAYRQSDVVTATRSVTAPTGLTTSATISGSNAVATVGGGTCAAGTTLKRQIRSLSNGVPPGGAWSAYADITTTTQSIPAQEGGRYNFQQQAQCLNTTTGVASAWTEGQVVWAIRPIATLSAPTVTAAGSSASITFNWSGSACPSGTTKEYRWYRTGSWGGTFGWYGPVSDTSNVWADASQGYTFTHQTQQRCASDFTEGAWSASGSASYARPVAAPGAPSGFTSERPSRAGIAFQWNPPTCGQGTSHQWRADWSNGNGTGIRWIGAPTGREDFWWYGTATVQLSGANPATAWSTALPSYGYMGDSNNPYSKRPPTMSLDHGTIDVFDTDNYIAMAVEYRCVNPTSGIAGPVGPVNMGSYKW